MQLIKPECDFLERFGPWALVAGASQGLGAEFATQLALKGLNLVLVARSPEKLLALAKRLESEYGVQVLPLIQDLAAPGAAAMLAEQTAGREIGLLICNAAFSAIGSFLETDLQAHLKEIDTNIRAPLVLVHTFGRPMLARRRGGILLMASLSSAMGSALIANYAATKAYTQILAEGLWEELRRQGVSVLACSPSAIATTNYLDSLDPGQATSLARALPPAEVAGQALAALGHQPSITPGLAPRLMGFSMQHLLPRRWAIQLVGRVLRGMYSR